MTIINLIYNAPDLSHFATQGPCPDGFHVPLTTEIQALYNTYTALGLSGVQNWETYLKMPKSGYRDSNQLNPGGQGTYGMYWSSSWRNTNYIYSFTFYGSNIMPSAMQGSAAGLTIRPFKNTTVTPDSSWTVLYQGTGNAGIYHNSSLGLISISSDGTNWITIADKNLGATTVYNYGDTLSEANCGKYYQWGNNYAFPRTGTLTDTSTTKVNASVYGPGNYYYSSTFILVSAVPYRWDSSDNKNLRGGEDGNVPV